MTEPSRIGTVAALGSAQTLAWASTYYLPAMLAVPMARDLGVSTPTVFAAFSVALGVSALMGPAAGRAIDRHGGRPVLMGTSILFALGLIALGCAQGAASLFAAWVLIGLAMGSGLYEAAFSTLVRLYGHGSRNAITGITLFAGFASTVGWPLSTLLELQLGWRGACFVWAALHLLVGLPLNFSLPRVPATATAHEAATAGDAAVTPSQMPPKRAGLTTALLAFVFAATWFISTAMAAHLPLLLQATGASLAVAVGVGALIGPAQVAGRLLEFGFLRHVHPLLSARLAAMGHPLGVACLLLAGPVMAPLFAVLHGAGNGILTIAKGTLPLVLFGPQGYGERQGWLMLPARVAQALAPFLFGLALARWGAGALWLSAALGLMAFLALLGLSASQPPPAPRAAA
jgi:predicted MFS family arabinose efflux permease